MPFWKAGKNDDQVLDELKETQKQNADEFVKKQEHADEVGESHQRVEGVGKNPDQIELGQSADGHDDGFGAAGDAGVDLGPGGQMDQHGGTPVNWARL